MTYTDLPVDLIINNLSDDSLKELEKLNQLEPNQLWLTPDPTSDNVQEGIAGLNSSLLELQTALNSLITEVGNLKTISSSHITLNTEQQVTGYKKFDNAKFLVSGTDYRNALTSPITHKTNKLFLLGVEGFNVKYSNTNASAYMQDGKLYSNGTEVSVSGHTHTKSQITDFDHTHSYLPLSGGTLTGHLNMNNYNLQNVNNITFADPGNSEGLHWTGGNGWKIYEAPDDLSNASGNLQFVTEGTRRFTIGTNGNVYILGTLYIS